MHIPKVSVVIPVYNTEAYVGEAIESAREQTLRDIEILVIDDGSTDRSPSVIRKLADTDSRIQIYTQTNQGVSAARNKGLEYVKGEFIYFLDSDDLLEKCAGTVLPAMHRAQSRLCIFRRTNHQHRQLPGPELPP